jgi:hypothetical protein
VTPRRADPSKPAPAHPASILVDVLARVLGAASVLAALAFAFFGWAGMLW